MLTSLALLCAALALVVVLVSLTYARSEENVASWWVLVAGVLGVGVSALAGVQGWQRLTEVGLTLQTRLASGTVEPPMLAGELWASAALLAVCALVTVATLLTALVSGTKIPYAPRRERVAAALGVCISFAATTAPAWVVMSWARLADAQQPERLLTVRLRQLHEAKGCDVCGGLQQLAKTKALAELERLVPGTRARAEDCVLQLRARIHSGAQRAAGPTCAFNTAPAAPPLDLSASSAASVAPAASAAPPGMTRDAAIEEVDPIAAALSEATALEELASSPLVESPEEVKQLKALAADARARAAILRGIPAAKPLSSGFAALAAATFTSLRPQISRCYQMGLALLKTAEGRLELELAIDAAGAVSNIESTATGTLPEAMVRCVRAVTRQAAFPPPTRGKANFTQVFNFTPNK